jgi:hypothetical protein
MRTSIQDVRSLGDPLQTYNWDVIFTRIPGTADVKPFTFKAMTTSIPGVLLESVPVALHGIELRYAGRANYTHQLPLTLLENRDVSTRDMLIKWNRSARDWISNTGTYKDAYSVTVQMLLYNDIPQVVRTINLYGCWPETVDDTAVDGQASGAVQTSVTLSFDYFEDV